MQSLEPYWLLWVVYAAEQGYAYDGHEYWDSFERNTSNWGHHQARRKSLQSLFIQFQRQFNGVIPSGDWAQWYSIISWPITHAIIPVYLQTRFTKAMHNARLELARIREIDTSTLGRILARNTWDSSSRFREFLQQEALVGRIMLALLDPTTIDPRGPLTPSTLSRITSDLERVHRSREWLRETRAIVLDRFKGAIRQTSYTASASTSLMPDRAQSWLLQRTLKPKIILRPSADRRWTPILELPSFSEVVRQGMEINTFLSTVRCQVSGTGNNWHPGGWLLNGSRSKVIKDWPKDDGILIKFETAPPHLLSIYLSECSIGLDTNWLFRVGDDGFARQVQSNILRPGYRYIVVRRGNGSLPGSHLADCGLDCSGVHGFDITLPASPPTGLIDELRRLGLSVSRAVQIRPAGVSAVNWDGEGHSEWLSTDRPCFILEHDHPVSEFQVSIDGGLEYSIAPAASGNATLVSLPALPPGKHELSVRVIRKPIQSNVAERRNLDATVELTVRDPSPWTPGRTLFDGLVVRFSPASLTLDKLWDGRVDVDITGPDGREIGCFLTLIGRDSNVILNESIGTLRLPVKADEFSARLEKFTSNEKHAWKYLEATSGTLSFSADELGTYKRPLEREARPVRFATMVKDHTPYIRLINDTDAEVPDECSFFSFSKPLTGVPIPSSDLATGSRVSPPGGLYVVRQGPHADTIVVGSSSRTVRLADIATAPEVSYPESSSAALLEFIKKFQIWHNARRAGPFAYLRQEQALFELVMGLYTRICGASWSQAEREFRRAPSDHSLDELQRHSSSNRSFAAVLRRGYTKALEDSDLRIRWFDDVARRYGLEVDLAYSRLALLLASQPLYVPTMFPEFEKFIDNTNKLQPLVKGARFAALLSCHSENQASPPIFPRWEW
ncbi:MAG: hypothetical protein ACK4GK_03355 [Ferrovibrio sp.]